ncbi:MAG: SPOR domain-containing protein [Phycisphaerales bacterium]|nr:SPOR domain-containing protein [Phycisphaerales bacterium]
MSALLLMGGCAPQGPTLDEAIHRYDRGLYATAQQMAGAVADASRGREADEAAWVAGLSAMHQDAQHPAARRWLGKVAASTDPSLRARAEAMLGELDRREGDWRGALRHYEAAWPGLDAAQQRNAAQAAISALRAAGDVPGMESWQHRLSGSDAAPTSGGWTLQAGAFRSRNGADSHRRSVERQSRGHALGDARLHRTTRNGRDLWLVHVGAFDSRAQAESARQRAPHVDLLIVRVP